MSKSYRPFTITLPADILVLSLTLSGGLSISDILFVMHSNYKYSMVGSRKRVESTKWCGLSGYYVLDEGSAQTSTSIIQPAIFVLNSEYNI